MLRIIRINDLENEELRLYSAEKEVQLFRAFEPKPGVFIAESIKVIKRALEAGYEPISFLLSEKTREKLWKEISPGDYDVPCYVAKEEMLEKITGYFLTGGALALMRRKTLISPKELLKGKHRIAVLENVENPTNAGAIVRSAAALGMEGILFTDGCTDPLYRRAVRVSMGTIFQTEWTFAANGPEAAALLKEAGFTCIAMALKPDSVSFSDFSFSPEDKTAVFLGTEGEGLTAETISACDISAVIPMTNGVDSLNVAAASAVAFFEVSRQSLKKGKAALNLPGNK